MSPCLFNFKKGNELTEIRDLCDLLDLLMEFTELKIQAYSPDDPTASNRWFPFYLASSVSKYRTLRDKLASVSNKMKQMLGEKKPVVLSDYPGAQIPSDYKLDNSQETSWFKSYLNYLDGKKAVIFLGPCNCSIHELPLKCTTDHEYELNASTILVCEQTDCLVSFRKKKDKFDDPVFPYKKMCEKMNGYILDIQKGKNKEEKIALYEKYGRIVAALNGYQYDQDLSCINSSKCGGKKRSVFKNLEESYYLSIDFESGGFEVFDKRPKHLGQYSFSCELAKPPAPMNHKLYLKN